MTKNIAPDLRGSVVDGRIRIEAERTLPMAERGTWQIKPYGFLTGLEVRLAEPYPNVDAANVLTVRLTIEHADGSGPAPAEVWATLKPLDAS